MNALKRCDISNIVLMDLLKYAYNVALPGYDLQSGVTYLRSSPIKHSQSCFKTKKYRIT